MNWGYKCSKVPNIQCGKTSPVLSLYTNYLRARKTPQSLPSLKGWNGVETTAQVGTLDKTGQERHHTVPVPRARSSACPHGTSTSPEGPGGLPVAAGMVKNLPAMQETRVPSLGWEDPLEEGMMTHSGILAWRIPWTEEPGGLRPWGRKESDTERLFFFFWAISF